MSLQNDTHKHYAIKEAAQISGLPESTLRYYEKIGLIEPISRDESSKYRIYTEADINTIVALACLSATGFSLEDMRQYMQNFDKGAPVAEDQKQLLVNQESHLNKEIRNMKLRLKYVKEKQVYWDAVKSGDSSAMEESAKKTRLIADELDLPRPL